MRVAAGWTQAELALRSGASRTAVTAIEAGKIVPSVAAALGIATALGTTVEALFADRPTEACEEGWAVPPPREACPEWRAEVGGRLWRYPAGPSPMLTLLPDERAAAQPAHPEETLVLACCDPAAGYLASLFAAESGLRLLVLPRSSRESIEMLRAGLVHLAGLHLGTRDDPEGNARHVRERLGPGYRLVRMAGWQEGVVLSPGLALGSARAVRSSRLRWVGREPGSGARQCLDRFLDGMAEPTHLARHHRGVAEAVSSGWAEAGVCLELVASEAGLPFIPLEQEFYDVCFAESLETDRRLVAFLNLVRSKRFRRLLAELPGYSTAETGAARDVAV